MLMYVGVSDKDVEQSKKGLLPRYPQFILRFRNNEGVEIKPETMIGKTIKLISQPVEGSFIVEVMDSDSEVR